MNAASELSLLGLFSLVCKKKTLEALGSREQFEVLKEESAVKALRRDHALVFEWQVVFNFWFLLLQKKPKVGFNVVYDGSQNPGTSVNRCYWLVTLSTKGKAKRRRVSRSEAATPLPLGRLRFPREHVEEDLPKLLGHLFSLSDHPAASSSYPDPPSNQQTTLAWLQHFNLLNRVVVRYCTSLLPRKRYVIWLQPENYTAGLDLVLLEAFTGKNGQLAFAEYRPPSDVRQRKCRPEKTVPSVEEPELRASQVNMASAVSNKLGGLTNAYFLGLLDRDSLKSLADDLKYLFGALWIHLDTEENVRHVAYSDYHTDGCCNFEIYPPGLEGNNPSCLASWKRFFDFLWERHLALSKLKAVWLGELLHQMEEQFAQPLTSKQATCLQQLQKYVSVTRVVLFSVEDRVLHALKVPFARFAQSKTPKYFRGIQLKTNDKNTLTSLTCSFMQVDNVSSLFGVGPRLETEEEGTAKEGKPSDSTKTHFTPSKRVAAEADDQFFEVARGWLPEDHVFKVPPLGPPLKLSPTLLKRHSSPVEWPGLRKDSRLLGYLDVRGRLLVNMLAKMFSLYCEFVLHKYLIELHTWPLSSLTSLAFQSVWISYCVAGGPLAQGLEKTKPYYNTLLRGFSRGGFSWSVVDQLSSGDVLHPGHDEKARGICEYDICSSYGYAASGMSCPGGFCVGYLANSESGGALELTDRFRHRRFEFRGTFKLIRDLQAQGADILAVYSNYHPLGLFYLGKHAVDLCVITRNSGHLLVQFDHVYSHGCRQGCPGTPSYASFKTRCQLEEETLARDRSVEVWVERVNAFPRERACCPSLVGSYRYLVVSECHSPGYSSRELDRAFAEGQPLHYLVAPYERLPPKRLEVCDLDRLPEDLTYLVICQGSVAEAGEKSVQPPLMVWNNGPDSADGPRRQAFSVSTEGRSVLLSRRHYEYLRRERGFRATSVAAVLFYRTDPVMPRVFAALTKDRYNAVHSPSQVNLIKCLINYACGYFGYNSAKKVGSQGRPKWLVSGFGKNVRQQLTHQYSWAGDFDDRSFYVRAKMTGAVGSSTAAASRASKPCNAALPIFLTVIDLGKLRLCESLSFIQRVTRPGAVKLLYTHVDNLILALGEGRLEDAVCPSRRVYYESHRGDYFQLAEQSQALPGQLKLEFELSTSTWKFASPFPCYYALVDAGANSDDRSKTLSLNRLSHADAYLCALKLLDQTGVTVEQERRVDKLSNSRTAVVQLRLGNSKK